MHIWQCITSFTTLVLLKLMEPIGCANTAANVTTLSFAANDLQCLTQMPMSELLRIQRNLHQMHAVSDYNDRMVEMRSITTAIARIKNQTTDYEQTDAVQPEARHTFETTAAQQQRQHQPSAASLSMPSHANNHFGYNQFGYGSSIFLSWIFFPFIFSVFPSIVSFILFSALLFASRLTAFSHSRRYLNFAQTRNIFARKKKKKLTEK